MNRLILVLTIGIISFGCNGNTGYSSATNAVTENDIASVQDGLTFSVSNQIPEMERGRAHLNVWFCSRLNTDQSTHQSSPTDEDETLLSQRCVRLNGTILNGSTETFIISRPDLEHIYQLGGGRAEFRFNDNFGTLSTPWFCQNESGVINIDPNFSHVQSWHIDVTNRNLGFTNAYGCRAERR